MLPLQQLFFYMNKGFPATGQLNHAHLFLPASGREAAQHAHCTDVPCTVTSVRPFLKLHVIAMAAL